MPARVLTSGIIVSLLARGGRIIGRVVIGSASPDRFEGSLRSGLGDRFGSSRICGGFYTCLNVVDNVRRSLSRLRGS